MGKSEVRVELPSIKISRTDMIEATRRHLRRIQAETEARQAFERTPWGRFITVARNLREELSLDKLKKRLEPVNDWCQAHSNVIGCALVSAVLLAAVIGAIVCLVLLSSADANEVRIAGGPPAIQDDRPEVEAAWAEPVEVRSTAGPAVVREEEAMPEPGWTSWCAKNGVPESSIDAIDKVVHELQYLLADEAIAGTAARATARPINCEPEALVAVLWTESRCRHWDGYTIRRGDSGRAIGIGQVHEDPWQKHCREQFGEQFDLRRLDDNVAACAYLLFERGGWKAGDEQAQLKALTYYNTGKRSSLPNGYAKRVHKLYREIKGLQAEPPAAPSEVRSPKSASVAFPYDPEKAKQLLSEVNETDLRAPLDELTENIEEAQR